MVDTALVPLQANGVALATPPAGALTEADWAERERLLRQVIHRSADPALIDVLLTVGKQYDLDPVLKHIDLIDGQVYVTHKGLLHKAHASGKLNGIELLGVGETSSHYTARVAVYRRDMDHAFVYPGRYAKDARNKRYGQEMAIARAECMALRRAFDIALSVQEELDWPTEPTSNAAIVAIEGQVVADDGAGQPPSPEPEPPQPPARSALPPGKVEDYDDDALLTVCGGDYPPAQLRKAATVYFGRAANRDELMDRFKAAYRAGLSREIADPVAKAAGEALKERAPGSYQHHARDDQQPILGDTPDERLAMLARIREAMATSGRDEEAVNKFVYATWRQAGIETLTAAEAEELIAILLARGEEEAAPDAVPERYPDDSDAVPFK